MTTRHIPDPSERQDVRRSQLERHVVPADCRVPLDDTERIATCRHDFESGSWGVILGVSRCLNCGVLATEETVA